MLINNYALYVKEYHDGESKVVHLLEGDKNQYDLINYLLEKTVVSTITPQHVKNETVAKTKAYKNQVRIISDGYNELIFSYESINLTIQIKEENLFDQNADILVVPTNGKLQLKGR
jgi:hypothetical protein